MVMRRIRRGSVQCRAVTAAQSIEVGIRCDAAFGGRCVLLDRRLDSGPLRAVAGRRGRHAATRPGGRRGQRAGHRGLRHRRLFRLRPAERVHAAVWVKVQFLSPCPSADLADSYQSHQQQIVGVSPQTPASFCDRCQNCAIQQHSILDGRAQAIGIQQTSVMDQIRQTNLLRRQHYLRSILLTPDTAQGHAACGQHMRHCSSARLSPATQIGAHLDEVESAAQHQIVLVE